MRSHHNIEVIFSLPPPPLSALPKRLREQKDDITAAHDALFVLTPFITDVLVNRQLTSNIPLFMKTFALGVMLSNFWRLLRL